MRYILILLLSLTALNGCATMQGVDEHVSFDLTEAPTFYRDQWVRKSPPEVYVEPLERASHPPRVLFIPFRVTQQMQDPKMVGYATSRAIFQAWSSMRLFPAMEFSSEETPYRRDVALRLGRARGADLVIGGFITYLYVGGTAGDTQLAVQIEGIDVVSGQIVWSMAQSGLIPASEKKDYLLFVTKTRLPADPVYAIARSIGGDTGKLIQDWLHGSLPPPDSALQKLDEGLKEGLFPEKNPLPPPRSDNAASEAETNNPAF